MLSSGVGIGRGKGIGIGRVRVRGKVSGRKEEKRKKVEQKEVVFVEGMHWVRNKRNNMNITDEEHWELSLKEGMESSLQKVNLTAYPNHIDL